MYISCDVQEWRVVSFKIKLWTVYKLKFTFGRATNLVRIEKRIWNTSSLITFNVNSMFSSFPFGLIEDCQRYFFVFCESSDRSKTMTRPKSGDRYKMFYMETFIAPLHTKRYPRKFFGVNRAQRLKRYIGVGIHLGARAQTAFAVGRWCWKYAFEVATRGKALCGAGQHIVRGTLA